MSVVTCRTEGCGNEGHGIEIDMTAPDDDGNDVPVDSVICGVCGQPITDVA